jgi:DNA-binding FrmR family transcriptional regulator
MDNMQEMLQQILAQINANQEKVEASMAKLLEDNMDSYQQKAEASMAKLGGGKKRQEKERWMSLWKHS